MRLASLIPMFLYGFYKNGIYLYQNHYGDLLDMMRPLIFLISGGLMGALVNFLWEKLIKHNKGDLKSILFSSFTIEYGVFLGAISSINTNLLVFLSVVFIGLLATRLFNNRLNVTAVCFIALYLISNFISPYDFANIYEKSKVFSLTLMDYLIGRGIGGIHSTHIIFLFIALLICFLTNNNKTTITISAIGTWSILLGLFCLIKGQDFLSPFFANNYLFIFGFIATDMVSSCYTKNGELAFGILLGILTFALYFVNPVLAPFIALIIVSILNNLLDRLMKPLKKH